jgi:nitroreductase
MEANEYLLLNEQTIWERKSTRSFNRSCVIEPDRLEHLLQAAMRAPSPKNRQPWHFTVVTEPSAKEHLAGILSQKLESLHHDRMERGVGVDDLDLAQGSVRVLRDASTLVFVTYTRDPQNEHGDPHSWCLSAQPFEVADLQAIGAAVENLLLAAVSNGIDSLWMCDVLYAHQEYQDCLSLRGPLVACVALGYQTTHQTPREPLESKTDYWNG